MKVGRKMGAEYPLTVYTPPTQGKARPAAAGRDGRCWLLVAFDGGFPAMESTLDNLIAAGKIPPVVAIGVENRSGESRDQDLNGSDRFAEFLATELVPWARQTYPVDDRASHTLIGGVSLGGLWRSTAAGSGRKPLAISSP